MRRDERMSSAFGDMNGAGTEVLTGRRLDAQNGPFQAQAMTRIQ